MHGFIIFKHSVVMVLRNFPQVLKTILPLSAIGALWVLGVVGFFGSAAGKAMSSVQIELSAGAIVLMFFTLLVWGITAWHRYVLLEDRGLFFLPAFRIGPMMSYVAHFLLLCLLMIVSVIPFGIFLTIGSAAGPMMMVVMMFFIVIGVTFCFYRLVIILPAAAIGKPLKIKEAWGLTTGAETAILVLVLLSSLVSLLLERSADSIAAIPVLGLPLFLFVQGVWGMVQVSVITTLYGHYVEGRPLS
ncbi:hypothetical protein [Epibacterium ulvae]|uniref:hypothetical protein n=1 Tax=Epibacterium ulvae TaxID=1156985 RepID=UPI0024921AE1|nr:hypothetical protein [Epibacterium ulvae]